MGKGSAKVPKDDAFDAGMKQQGPGLSDPLGPILQLTLPGSMPGFGGQIPFGQSFAQQLGGLPPGLLEQIKALQSRQTQPPQISVPQVPPPLSPLEQAPRPKAAGTSFDPTRPIYGVRRG